MPALHMDAFELGAGLREAALSLPCVSPTLPGSFQCGWMRPDWAKAWAREATPAFKLLDEGSPGNCYSDLALVPTKDFLAAWGMSAGLMEKGFEEWMVEQGEEGWGVLCAWIGPEDGHSMIALFLSGDPAFLCEHPIHRLPSRFDTIDIGHAECANYPADSVRALAKLSRAEGRGGLEFAEISKAARALLGWIHPSLHVFENYPEAAALLEHGEISESALGAPSRSGAPRI